MGDDVIVTVPRGGAFHTPHGPMEKPQEKGLFHGSCRKEQAKAGLAGWGFATRDHFRTLAHGDHVWH